MSQQTRINNVPDNVFTRLNPVSLDILGATSASFRNIAKKGRQSRGTYSATDLKIIEVYKNQNTYRFVSSNPDIQNRNPKCNLEYIKDSSIKINISIPDENIVFRIELNVVQQPSESYKARPTKRNNRYSPYGGSPETELRIHAYAFHFINPENINLKDAQKTIEKIIAWKKVLVPEIEKLDDPILLHCMRIVQGIRIISCQLKYTLSKFFNQSLREEDFSEIKLAKKQKVYFSIDYDIKNNSTMPKMLSSVSGLNTMYINSSNRDIHIKYQPQTSWDAPSVKVEINLNEIDIHTYHGIPSLLQENIRKSLLVLYNISTIYNSSDILKNTQLAIANDEVELPKYERIQSELKGMNPENIQIDVSVPIKNLFSYNFNSGISSMNRNLNL